MNTTFYVPDHLFRSAQALADRLGISMDEIVSPALQTYVAAHSRDPVTSALNELYTDEPSALDKVVAQMQWLSLPWEDQQCSLEGIRR